MATQNKSQPESIGNLTETRMEAGYPDTRPFWVKAGTFGPDTLSSRQVAELLLENPEKEYVDGYTVRCKKCGKIRGRLIWSEPPGAERWLVIPVHYNHLDADPKVRARQCQCDLFQEEKQKQQDDSLLRQAEIDRNRRDAGLPRRYESTGFADIPKETPGRDTAQAFCKAARADLQRGLGLWIQTGPKTDSAALCAAIGNTLLEQGYRVYYITPARFARTVRENQKNRVSSDEMFEQVRHCPFLLVDEWDSAEYSEPLQKSEWALKEFLIELGQRYDDRLPAVFCSPDTPEEMIRLHPSSERLFRKATAFVREHNGRVVALPEPSQNKISPEDSGMNSSAGTGPKTGLPGEEE